MFFACYKITHTTLGINDFIGVVSRGVTTLVFFSYVDSVAPSDLEPVIKWIHSSSTGACRPSFVSVF